MLCCSQHCLTITQKKTSMWKILYLCDKLEVFLDSENEALSDDGKEWKVIAKSSVDLNENGSKYWARTNDAYQRNLIERKALANEIRNVVKMLMPLRPGRVENVFALFSSLLFWIRADEKQNVLDCQFCIHFLDCLKDGRKRPLCPKRCSSKESWNGQKFVCCVFDSIVWFGALR